MKNKGLYYGVNIDTDELVHISDAKRGNDCNCKCPFCNENLQAKKGKINIHHFAHIKNQCSYIEDGENGILLFIKKIIKDNKYITIQKTKTNKEVIKLNFDSIEEDIMYDSYTPDLTAYINDKPYLLEIEVSEKIPYKKCTYYKENKIDSIKIVINKDFIESNDYDNEDFIKTILDYPSSKYWIYNSNDTAEEVHSHKEKKNNNFKKYNSENYEENKNNSFENDCEKFDYDILSKYPNMRALINDCNLGYVDINEYKEKLLRLIDSNFEDKMVYFYYIYTVPDKFIGADLYVICKSILKILN